MASTQRPQDKWFFPRGSRQSGVWESVVGREIDGWQHTGLRIITLSEGGAQLPADDIERAFVPLSGSFSIRYTIGDGPAEVRDLEGRKSVFAGPTDVLYLGAGTQSEITGSGRLCIAEAPTTEVLAPYYLPQSDVPVELRGRGITSRKVHNFGAPHVLPASRFMVVEVITPSGNWSSFPPHKHDTDIPGKEANLEEIYYFESQSSEALNPSEICDPHGFMRTYSSDRGEMDLLVEVRTGDIVLVPHGYHGPTVATPGYDLYMLNVMAGPMGKREWLLTEDHHHSWVKDALSADPLDPRLA